MPAFKSDTSFLEKISMGATGTLKVLDNLTGLGHRPIELERFSTNFKIWKNIKIKRIRVPDILCLACGRRVESRAKAAFVISMSHSLSDPERGWDAGLNDDDYVAFAVCEKSGDRPIDWTAIDLVQFTRVKELRYAYSSKNVIAQKPKGAGEGFELRLVWPAAVASSAGVVTNVTDRRLQYRRPDNRVITLSLARGNLVMTPLVGRGDQVVPEQALAAVVPVIQSFDCDPALTDRDYVHALSGASLTERYTASKALSHLRTSPAQEALDQKLSDDREHVYVRLECAAGLARAGREEGWRFIEERLRDEYLSYRLEAVIVLAEIPDSRSRQLLAEVVRDTTQAAEIRAGAAWALGERYDAESLEALVDSFADTEHLLRVEAARALAKLCTRFSSDVAKIFPRVTPDQRPGVAWALSQAQTIKVEELLDSLIDEDTRQWVAYIIGTQQQSRMADEIAKLRDRDSEVYFAVTVLWKITTSWVFELESYG